MPHTLFLQVLQLSRQLAKVSELFRTVSCAYIFEDFKINLHTQQFITCDGNVQGTALLLYGTARQW
jgi:hypothetical protein